MRCHSYWITRSKHFLQTDAEEVFATGEIHSSVNLIMIWIDNDEIWEDVNGYCLCIGIIGWSYAVEVVELTWKLF